MDDVHVYGGAVRHCVPSGRLFVVRQDGGQMVRVREHYEMLPHRDLGVVAVAQLVGRRLHRPLGQQRQGVEVGQASHHSGSYSLRAYTAL